MDNIQDENIPMNERDFDTPQYHVDSISKLLKIASSNLYTDKTHPNKWIYRGDLVYNRKNGLLPGIGRDDILEMKFKGNKEKLLAFEEQAFNTFKVKVYNELRYSDDYSYLAAAQHHGLKTRLLDWTLNILVGLYFAVEDANTVSAEKQADGALYAYQMQKDYKFNDFPRDAFILNLKDSDHYYIETPYVSPRIKVQQGVFQLFTDPFKPFDNVYNLIKLRIMKERKTEIKRQLFEMGIHAEMLFPDLDGLCRSINYYCLNS
jgi:hypothetical protein